MQTLINISEYLYLYLGKAYLSLLYLSDIRTLKRDKAIDTLLYIVSI